MTWLWNGRSAAYGTQDTPDSGTIALAETMRGNRRHQETINVPNWPSDEHVVSVYFKDYAAKTYSAR